MQQLVDTFFACQEPVLRNMNEKRAAVINALHTALDVSRAETAASISERQATMEKCLALDAIKDAEEEARIAALEADNARLTAFRDTQTALGAKIGEELERATLKLAEMETELQAARAQNGNGALLAAKEEELRALRAQMDANAQAGIDSAFAQANANLAADAAKDDELRAAKAELQAAKAELAASAAAGAAKEAQLAKMRAFLTAA